MLFILLVILAFGGGLAIGFILGHPGPFWPLKKGMASSKKSTGPTEIDGFLFDPLSVASIPDEEWLRLRGKPGALRRYIDQQAYKSQELEALRSGVLAARQQSLQYYSEGAEALGSAKKNDAVTLEWQADNLEASLKAR